VSSVMDNRSNWLFWQVHPSSFVSNCWDCWLQFFYNKRSLEQSCEGGWCCDGGSIKAKRTLVSEELNAGCWSSKTFMNASYRCKRIAWLVVTSLLDDLGGSLSFSSTMLFLVRQKPAKQHELKRIIPPDSLFQKLWMFIYNQ